MSGLTLVLMNKRPPSPDVWFDVCLLITVSSHTERRVDLRLFWGIVSKAIRKERKEKKGVLTL
jgi:hypothetical protein